MRLQPMTVVGDRSSATAGSSTMSRILLRTNSAARSLASLREQQVAERSEEGQPAVRPPLLELPLALLGVGGEGELLVARGARAEGRHGLGVGGAQGGVVGLDGRHLVGVERPVVGGHGVGGRALEHGEVGGLLGDDGDELDRRRSRADHAHALAGEVDALVRPATGVVGVALERVDALEVGDVRRRQAPGGHDEELGRYVIADIGGDRPALGRLVEHGRLDPRVELDVAPQVEPVGHVTRVLEDLGLGRVALRPLPFLLQVVVELVGVLHALDVAAGPGIAVPVPGAADVAAGLVDASRQAEASQSVEHVHAGEAGSDDHRVEVAVRCRFAVRTGHGPPHWPTSPTSSRAIGPTTN